MKKLSMFLFLFLAIQIVASAENPIKFQSFKGFNTTSPKSIKAGGGDFEQGIMVLSLGYGVPNMTAWFLGGLNSTSDYSVGGLGPIHGKFEYAVTDEVGLGMNINYVNTLITFQDNATGGSTNYKYELNIMNTAFNARFNYHFFAENSLDIYTGVGFGYRIGSYKYTTNDPNFDINSSSYTGAVIPIGFEVSLGARYYITELIGAYMEVGLAKSIIQAGVTVKL